MSCVFAYYYLETKLAGSLLLCGSASQGAVLETCQILACVRRGVACASSLAVSGSSLPCGIGVVFVLWLPVFSGCLCSVVACVQWLLVSMVVCVPVPMVPQTSSQHSLVACVHWLLEFTGCLRSLVACDRWLLVFTGCLCSLDFQMGL